MNIPQFPLFAVHWYKDCFLPSFTHNGNCCPEGRKRQEKQDENITDKAINNPKFLPGSLENAPGYVKELVVRSGQLLRYYFANGCTKPETTLKITIEQTPELKYFVEACKMHQQIYGGDDYVLFDRIF